MATSDGEILGLQDSGNGRSCVQHPCCGITVVSNDIIRFKTTVIDGIIQSDGILEEAIMAILICDEKCFVL